MTMREYFQKYLESKGMWPKGASSVMDIVVADSISKDVQWDSAREGHPEPLMAVLMVTVDKIALDWIEENEPEAWYRSMFK